jgi:ADP-heptose:LPS heptosyltransferase
VNLSDPASLLPNLPQGSRILILRLRSLGDTVLLTPALAALHAWRPDLRLSVLLEPAFAPVLEGNPAVTETLVLRGSVAAVAMLRRRKFQAAYNQHSGPRSAILTGLCGAPARVSWAGRQFSFFYNVAVPGYEVFFGRADGHTVEHATTPFYWTGLPRGPIPPAAVYPQPDAVAAIEKKLAEHGIPPDKPYAVLRPGASAAKKRWPVEQFASLARWLREEKGFAVVTNLGPGDGDVAEETRRALAPEAALLDSLDLRELTALLARAELFVGNDSGPTHIAAALARPTIVIFGASNPVHWAPWQAPHRLLQQEGAGSVRSIAAITNEQVRTACDNLLAEARSQPARS